jgi:hypothetical protein
MLFSINTLISCILVDPIEKMSEKVDLKQHPDTTVQKRAPHHIITLFYVDRTPVIVMQVTARFHDEFRWFPPAFE